MCERVFVHVCVCVCINMHVCASVQICKCVCMVYKCLQIFSLQQQTCDCSLV